MSRKITRAQAWRQRLLPLAGSAHEDPESSPRDPAAGWATRNEEINDGNVLWRQYTVFVDLYRYYIDLIWKVTIWYYTAVGLSLAYLFSHLSGQNYSYLPLLLIFLSALSVGVALIFLRSVLCKSDGRVAGLHFCFPGLARAASRRIYTLVLPVHWRGTSPHCRNLPGTLRVP
jgi:hypothetical protein